MYELKILVYFLFLHPATLTHPALFRDYEITKGKMDDVFLAVTGRALTGGEGA